LNEGIIAGARELGEARPRAIPLPISAFHAQKARERRQLADGASDSLAPDEERLVLYGSLAG
jgi:hypothetical protein